MPGLRDPKLKLEISKAFKLSGYQLRVEASRHLEDLLAPVKLARHGDQLRVHLEDHGRRVQGHDILR